MPTTVAQGFNELRNRLTLTENQVDTADARVSRLRNFLANEFQLSATPIKIGSYARNTIVRPERDIDLLVPLDYLAYKDSSVGDDSRALLYLVRNALNEQYRYTKVSSQQVAIKLDFTDITVDVVPAYPRRGGGYLISNGATGWQATNPPFHTNYMATANVESGSMLKILVRLMKYWNIVNGKHLSSLHVELTVARMWAGIDMSGRAVSDLMAVTLIKMPGWIRGGCPDPWDGSGSRIDSYLSSADRQTTINLLTSDGKAAEQAEIYRASSNIVGAYERWGVVFRHNFPSYG